MTEHSSLYVSQAEDKTWEVRRGKAGEVLQGAYSTRAEAESAARKAVAGAGGGEVCVEVPKANRPET